MFRHENHIQHVVAILFDVFVVVVVRFISFHFLTWILTFFATSRSHTYTLHSWDHSLNTRVWINPLKWRNLNVILLFGFMFYMNWNTFSNVIVTHDDDRFVDNNNLIAFRINCQPKLKDFCYQSNQRKLWWLVELVGHSESEQKSNEK